MKMKVEVEAGQIVDLGMNVDQLREAVLNSVRNLVNPDTGQDVYLGSVQVEVSLSPA